MFWVPQNRAHCISAFLVTLMTESSPNTQVWLTRLWNLFPAIFYLHSPHVLTTLNCFLWQRGVFSQLVMCIPSPRPASLLLPPSPCFLDTFQEPVPMASFQLQLSVLFLLWTPTTPYLVHWLWLYLHVPPPDSAYTAWLIVSQKMLREWSLLVLISTTVNRWIRRDFVIFHE